MTELEETVGLNSFACLEGQMLPLEMEISPYTEESPFSFMGK